RDRPGGAHGALSRRGRGHQLCLEAEEAMSDRPARSLRPPSALREIPGPRDFVQREPVHRQPPRGWSVSLAALGGGIVGMMLGAAALLLSQRFAGEDAAVRAADAAIALD